VTNASLRFAVLVVILVSFASLHSWAGHLEQTNMTVLITSASTVDERVERILTESTLIYLERESINTVLADYDLSDDEPSRRDITRLAREGGSDFVLIGTYNPSAESASSLTISFTIYLADPAIPVATYRGDAKIDLTLDRTIADFLDILLDEAFAYLSETGSDVISNSTGGEAAPTNGETTVTGDSVLVPEIVPGAGADQPAVVQDTIEFSFGYAPAFAVGDASGYYQIAQGASASLHLVLGKRNGIGIGITGSAVFTSATGVATDGELLIVPFAGSLAFRSEPAPLGAFLSLGGGGALIRVTNTTLGTFMKLTPYATASVGMKLAFLNWIGINAGVTFDAVFEGSVMITSFAPSISLYLGL
jgi:hypothetical protein